MTDEIAAYGKQPGFDGNSLGVSLHDQGTVRLHVGPKRRTYDIDVSWLWKEDPSNWKKRLILVTKVEES